MTDQTNTCDTILKDLQQYGQVTLQNFHEAWHAGIEVHDNEYGFKFHINDPQYFEEPEQALLAVHVKLTRLISSIDPKILGELLKTGLQLQNPAPASHVQDAMRQRALLMENQALKEFMDATPGVSQGPPPQKRLGAQQEQEARVQYPVNRSAREEEELRRQMALLLQRGKDT